MEHRDRCRTARLPPPPPPRSPVPAAAFLILAALFAAACGTSGPPPSPLETRSERIESGFARAGLGPGGPGGEYMHSFLARAGTRPARASFYLIQDGPPVALDPAVDFQPLAFSGSGRVARGVSDFKLMAGGSGAAEQDLEGRIAFLLTGRDDAAGGETAEEIFRLAREAEARGAAALIVVRMAGFGDILSPFDHGWTGERVSIPVLQVKAAVLATRHFDFERPGVPGFEVTLPVTGIEVEVEMQDVSLSGTAVVGTLEGSDPALRHEVVVVGAWFERGHGPADDSSAGALVELARLVAEEPRSPRTIAFVAFSARELGLAGSFAQMKEPFGPTASTVAFVRIGAVGRSPAGRLTVRHGGESSAPWRRVVAEGAAKAGLEIDFAPSGEERSASASLHRRDSLMLLLTTGVAAGAPGGGKVAGAPGQWDDRVVALAASLVRGLADPSTGAPVDSTETARSVQ